MDEILREVRRTRDELVAENGRDLHKLCVAMRELQKRHPDRVVDLAKDRPERESRKG